MNRRNRIARWLLALAAAGTTFVTTGTCDPYTGFLDFYRNDDSGNYFFNDIIDDSYYYDPYYYYEDPYYYNDCWLCF